MIYYQRTSVMSATLAMARPADLMLKQEKLQQKLMLGENKVHVIVGQQESPPDRILIIALTD